MPSSYKEPPWAHTPSCSNSWSLIEIKGGMEVGTHALQRSCTLLGRAADMVHIPLHHESCSRQHSRIAFDQRGCPWLRDLQSTHGTFVNKKQLPPQAVGKEESNSTQKGSRGVLIYPGDVLQFGASTRVFCLEGPAEFERGAMKSKAAQQSSSTSAVNSAAANQLHKNASENMPEDDDKDDNRGISWGMDMDDPSESLVTDDSSLHEPLDPAKVPPGHQKALERLLAKKHKLENLERESERIRRKGVAGELTEGQTQQLQKNTERQTSLQSEIQEIQEELLNKINQKGASQQHRRASHKQQHEDDDDVDDFYDKTIDHSHKETHQSGETEESLTSEWKRLHGMLLPLDLKISRCHQEVVGLQQRVRATRDTEDAFFVQNDLNLAQDVYQKALAEKRGLEKELDETERLLRIVNDKLVMDRTVGVVGSSIMPPPPAHKKEEATMMPPPSLEKEESSTLPPPTDNDNFMPPPKRKRTLGPPMSPPSAALATQDTDTTLSPSGFEPADNFMPPPQPKKHAPEQSPMLPPPAKKGPLGPSRHAAMGTLSGLAGSSDSTKKDESVKRPERKNTPAVNDPKKDEWRAPEGQDGSGVTRLNAKFAGRY